MNNIRNMSVFSIMYARLVMRGKLTVEEVPKCFADEVKEILEYENKHRRVPD